jgi:hydroxymethylpyrimidine pyrophosphatase-like HAD family hydrolase
LICRSILECYSSFTRDASRTRRSNQSGDRGSNPLAARSIPRVAAYDKRHRQSEHYLYFLALATDYDGTIALHGVVDAQTVGGLERLKQTGRRLILVTGRDLTDLERVFPQLALFDRIVAENGGLLYDPATEERRPLAPAPPPAFVEALRAREVLPLSIGACIVATWQPNETVVLDTIRELGLELQITFNKGAVMVLPPGVNKASGLAAAIRELELSAVNVVGVGDAENDHAFLRICGCSAAVANALPALKEEVDIRLAADHGAGVVELVGLVCRSDADLAPRARHGILIGNDRFDQPVYLEPHAGGVLIAGSSGIGKSTVATALTERMAEKELQFCVFDPEGDYEDLEHAVSIGDPRTPPNAAEAEKLLRTLTANVVVNTQSMSMAERPEFFASLLPRLAALRARTGRPHWLIVDEAHHLLAVERGGFAQVLPEQIPAVIYITVHPDAVSPAALRSVNYVLALGDAARKMITTFCNQIGVPVPPEFPPLDEGEALFWSRSGNASPFPVRLIKPRQSRRRHTTKYAEGELDKDSSFYFRGPDGKLNLRAQNLMLFAQIAEGVDEPTWEYHRKARDYSAWFKTVIKDDELAQEAAAVETDPRVDAHHSRRLIMDAVRRRYTAPARGHRSN